MASQDGMNTQLYIQHAQAGLPAALSQAFSRYGVMKEGVMVMTRRIGQVICCEFSCYYRNIPKRSRTEETHLVSLVENSRQHDSTTASHFL